METKRHLPNVKCKWCGTWKVYECKYAPHKDIFGNTLSCKQCNGTGKVCTDPKHTQLRKQPWDL